MRCRRVKPENGEGVFHCISKVVWGEFAFGDREKEVFRGMMRRVAVFCGVEVLTYCVMSNHFHVLIRVRGGGAEEPLGDVELLRRVRVLYGRRSEVASRIEKRLVRERDAERRRLLARMGDVSAFMKEFKQRYTFWYNRTHQKVGTLWTERFKSVLVEGDVGAMRVMAAYIDLNPVRAGICKDPKDYRWSGYGEAVGGVASARDGLRGVVGDREKGWEEVQAVYRQWLYLKGERGSEGKSGVVMDSKEVRKVLEEGGKLSVEELLRCRVKYLTAGVVFGSKGFVDDWYEMRGRDFFPRSKRKVGGQGMRGGGWGNLAVFRKPRGGVFA